MKLSRNIRSVLGRYQYAQDVKKVRAKRETVGFDEAKKIGILYDATDERDYETVKNYVKQVRSQYKKDILAMGFVDRKQLPPSQFAQYGLDFFTRKDLNFRMIPIDPIVQNFIHERFDILINLHSGRSFPLQYIAAMSNARFRVGRYDKRNMLCYDMMIQLAGEPGIKTMIEEMENFLRKLKP